MEGLRKNLKRITKPMLSSWREQREYGVTFYEKYIQRIAVNESLSNYVINMLEKTNWQLHFFPGFWNFQKTLVKISKEQAEMKCNDQCLDRAEMIYKQYFIATILYERTFYDELPPGLYLAYFNRFSNHNSKSFLSNDWIRDWYPRQMEYDFHVIFESLSAFLTKSSLQNISLLDIPVLGAKSKSMVGT